MQGLSDCIHNLHTRLYSLACIASALTIGLTTQAMSNLQQEKAAADVVAGQVKCTLEESNAELEAARSRLASVEARLIQLQISSLKHAEVSSAFKASQSFCCDSLRNGLTA